MTPEGAPNDETRRPILTADAVVFSVTPTDISVLLIRRAKEPFAGQWALPGGHVEYNENPRDAALRELREETGVVGVASDAHLVGVYSDPARDPRGHTVSIAYIVAVEDTPELRSGSDASAASFVRLSDLQNEPLAFDHHTILRDAVARIKRQPSLLRATLL